MSFQQKARLAALDLDDRRKGDRHEDEVGEGGRRLSEAAASGVAAVRVARPVAGLHRTDGIRRHLTRALHHLLGAVAYEVQLGSCNSTTLCVYSRF